MDEIVEPKSELVVFDKVAAIIADYKVKNEELAFDYESKEGIKQVKGHIAKLRKVKTKVGEIHKEAKAEALAFGRRLDAKKNEYNGEVDKMIAFHQKPLEAIEAKETKEALARQQEYADTEAKRIAEIEARERAIILAEEKIAREKAEAEEKVRRENEAEADRIIFEQQEKIAKIEEENRSAKEAAERLEIQAEEKAKAEGMIAEAKELAEEERLADIAAEKAIEASRINDEKYRKSIEDDIYTALLHFVDVGPCASAIVAHMKAGEIPHVTINY
jgi:hypothetical protein